ncbi:MAG: universal stress protein [Nitrospira sp.]
MVGSTARSGSYGSLPVPVVGGEGRQGRGRCGGDRYQADRGARGIFSTCSLDALEYAVQFAKPLGAAITILHAMEPVAYGLDFSLSHAKEWKEQRDYLEKRLSVLSACLTAHRNPGRSCAEAGAAGRFDRLVCRPAGV